MHLQMCQMKFLHTICFDVSKFQKRVGEIRTVKGLDRVRENDLFQMTQKTYYVQNDYCV